MGIQGIKRFYAVAAAYDGLLGLVFLFAFKDVFGYFGVTLPNHDAYIQFPALLLVIFGIGFLFVAKAPHRNRDIIKLGVLLKASYSGVVFYYAWQGNMPSMWLPFAYADAAFLVGFLWTLARLERLPEA